MITQKQVSSNSGFTASSQKELDLSQAYLREIFGTKDDFSKGIIKEITPAIANKLLERNIINRPLRQRHVDWLANQMKSGYWRFSGDSIKLNTDGILVDKQHTLHAIVQSGTTQKFVVIGGLDDTIIDVIDTGIARTAGDVLKMNGVPNPNTLAAICRRVLAFKNKNTLSSFNAVQTGMKRGLVSDQGMGFVSNHRILEEVMGDSRYADACANAGKFYEGSRILSTSQYGLLYFLFSEKDPDDAMDFLSKFSSGLGLKADSPIYILRKRLEKERETKVRFSEPLKMYWIFTCWNKFRKRESISLLQTPQKIDIPEIL